MRDAPVWITSSSNVSKFPELLSFLPESDVARIVEYSASIGKKSFAALLPDNAYGAVVEGAFKTAVSRRGGRDRRVQETRRRPRHCRLGRWRRRWAVLTRCCWPTTAIWWRRLPMP